MRCPLRAALEFFKRLVPLADIVFCVLIVSRKAGIPAEEQREGNQPDAYKPDTSHRKPPVHSVAGGRSPVAHPRTTASVAGLYSDGGRRGKTLPRLRGF